MSLKPRAARARDRDRARLQTCFDVGFDVSRRVRSNACITEHVRMLTRAISHHLKIEYNPFDCDCRHEPRKPLLRAGIWPCILVLYFAIVQKQLFALRGHH